MAYDKIYKLYSRPTHYIGRKKPVKIRFPKFLGFHIVIRAEKCAEKMVIIKKINSAYFCTIFALQNLKN